MYGSFIVIGIVIIMHLGLSWDIVPSKAFKQKTKTRIKKVVLRRK